MCIVKKISHTLSFDGKLDCLALETHLHYLGDQRGRSRLIGQMASGFLLDNGSRRFDGGRWHHRSGCQWFSFILLWGRCLGWLMGTCHQCKTESEGSILGANKEKRSKQFETLRLPQINLRIERVSYYNTTAKSSKILRPFIVFFTSFMNTECWWSEVLSYDNSYILNKHLK